MATTTTRATADTPGLSDAQREAVALRDEGLNRKDIAERIGKSTSAVGSLLYAADKAARGEKPNGGTATTVKPKVDTDAIAADMSPIGPALVHERDRLRSETEAARRKVDSLRDALADAEERVTEFSDRASAFEEKATEVGFDFSAYDEAVALAQAEDEDQEGDES